MEFNTEGLKEVAQTLKEFAQNTTVAGVAGSLASLLLTPFTSFKTCAGMLFIGAAFSFYALGPLLVWLGVKSVEGGALGAFMLSLLGYNILSKLKKYSDETSFPELVTNLLNVFRKSP